MNAVLQCVVAHALRLSLAACASLGLVWASCTVFDDAQVETTPPPVTECPDLVPDDQCNEDRAPLCDLACEGEVADGECTANLDGLETCRCPDCANADLCLTLCNTNGACDENDTCFCPDCVDSGYCYSLVYDCCNGDGVCDAASEACACSDCQGLTQCADHLADCIGAPDGECAEGEECLCPDCLAVYECVVTSCELATECLETTACICAPCAMACTGCDKLDGVCDALNEGCGCADCATTEYCLPPSPPPKG